MLALTGIEELAERPIDKLRSLQPRGTRHATTPCSRPLASASRLVFATTPEYSLGSQDSQVRRPAALIRGHAAFAVGVAFVLVGAASALAVTTREGAHPPTLEARGVLVFASARGGTDLQLYTMEPGPEANVRPEPLGGGIVGLNPRWSPTGDRIAFVRDGDLWIVNADGAGGARNLTRSKALDTNPSWSPDGTKLAFASNLKGNFDIYAMKVDPVGTLKRLTRNDAVERYPAWSPDGERIAFQRGPAIVTMRAGDGLGIAALATAGENVSPAWSPDGTRIAFASRRGPHDGNYEIYVMSRSGSKQTRLTTDSLKPFSDTDPTWSPDGKQLAFTSTRGDNGYDIFTITVDGYRAATKQLTNDSAQDTTSDWWPAFTTSAAMRARVESGVLRIRAFGGCDYDTEEGTGFVVGDRLVLTANHVVRGAERIDLLRGSSRVARASIVGRDSKNDVALLRTTSATPLGYRFRLATGAPTEDGTVTVFGYREHGGRTRRETRIEATNQTSTGEGGGKLTGLIRLTEYLEPGNSGSPVVISPTDELGALNAEPASVVGLVVRRGSTTSSFALPTARFRGDLGRWRTAATKPRERCP